MELSLKNIGKVKEATVEIRGITVIAGENNTGKSTVGKALFSIFNTFFDVDGQIKRERTHSITKIIDSSVLENPSGVSSRAPIELIGKYIVDNAKNSSSEDIYAVVISAINYCNERYDCKFESENFSESFISRLSDVLKISDDDILLKMLNDRIDDEFNEQLSNIFSDELGEITLTIRGRSMHAKILDNNVQEISSSLSLKTEAIYIDDPFVIDDRRIVYIGNSASQAYNHRRDLKHKLFSEKQDTDVISIIITKSKFDAIFEKIGLDFECNTFKSRRPVVELRRNGEDKLLSIKNLSTGMKTFLIIKTLLINGAIQHNGTIILDEPEIHLHPEWQLLFAELIVLIQKEFSMHILLTTHSPYFMRAIQVYAAKHEIADNCKYYMSHMIHNEAYINDVTNDVEQIYKKLLLPFQKLDDERWSND